MSLVKEVEIRPLTSVRGGMAEFYTPQASHETILVQIPPGTVDDLFVHRFQTDQLLVVRGDFVLVVLQGRCYQYIPLSENHPAVVKVPRGVLHGAINLSPHPCMVVNALLRHGPAHERDYRPLQPPFPYDLVAAQSAIAKLETPISA